MPFNLYAHRWVVLEPICVAFKGCTRFFREIIAVETEVDVLDWLDAGVAVL
jgi:hypothetical protein